MLAKRPNQGSLGAPELDFVVVTESSKGERKNNSSLPTSNREVLLAMASLPRHS